MTSREKRFNAVHKQTNELVKFIKSTGDDGYTLYWVWAKKAGLTIMTAESFERQYAAK